jgi:nickel-dependent lactate racemase
VKVPKQQKILYGNKEFAIDFPPHTHYLSIREPDKKITGGIFQKKLDSFLTQNPLDLSQPILVVTDKTRLCGYPKYLPLLVFQLENHGLQRKKLQIIIAYGTHQRQTEQECMATYGECYNNFQFIHHDCNDKEIFLELGHTSSGTPIRLRKDLLEASVVITMGPICHHYFAGYGGGRKLIFPGCGEKEAIYHNHGIYLDKHSKILSPTCQPGILEDNPLAVDLFEIEERRPADMAIHAILNFHGEVTDILMGNMFRRYIQRIVSPDGVNYASHDLLNFHHRSPDVRRSFYKV